MTIPRKKERRRRGREPGRVTPENLISHFPASSPSGSRDDPRGVSARKNKYEEEKGKRAKGPRVTGRPEHTETRS